MKSIYQNLSEKKFKQLCVSICLIFDIIICIWIYNNMTALDRFNQSISAMTIVIPEIKQILETPDLINELYASMLLMIKIILGTFLSYHLLIYTLFLKSYKFTYFYLKIYIWSAIIGCFLMGIQFISPFKIGALFTLMSPVYLFLAFGLNKFPYTAKNEAQ